MSHLGVDPGLHGAWALLDGKGGLVAADHFPLDAEGEIDAAALVATWRALAPARATVESVGSMGATKDGRKQGVQGIFNFGRRYGAALAALDVLGIPRDGVRPDVWKRATGVSAVKQTSLKLARLLWPAHAATTLKRVKDKARAEAALIARYGQARSPRRAA
jgi:crossover junction endodeoxyribonuclease RuvC